MPNYLEILRLDSLNHSQRTIESTVHCSRHTVRSVLQAAKEKQIAWPLEDDITNAELEEILFPGKYKSGCRYVEPDYPYIHRELAKPGVTMALLWEEYCRKCHEAGETPYMNTQFGDKYRRWARVTKATMRIQHKPGDAMQVDWAGDTLPVYDLVTGKQSPAYLFMAVLPCSCYTYAEVCEDMKTENWLSCHVHAFQYFGGVTRLLIPDNCKTATTANTRYETVLNRSYQELAEYYGTAIVPARVRKPQDKSAAEASVRFAQTWIIAALRERKFFSVREMNEAIAEKLEELNNRPFQRMAGTRRSAWLEEEKPYMLPLPAVPFEAAVWSVAKVPNDYLVSDGRNKYSVPYNLIGEKVDIRVTKTAVEVFYHGSRVASHRRLQTIQREPLVKLVPCAWKIGGEAGIVTTIRSNKDAIIAICFQGQETVSYTIPAEHTAFVLHDERLICQGCDLQPFKILVGKLHHLFDLAVVHLETGWIAGKIYFDLQCVSLRSTKYFRYIERSMKSGRSLLSSSARSASATIFSHSSGVTLINACLSCSVTTFPPHGK